MIEVYADGACNRKVPTYGFAVYRDGVCIYDEKGVVKNPIQKTSNVAEWKALLKALDYLDKNHYQREFLTVRMDSQLIIMQAIGEYKVRKEHLKPYYERAVQLLSMFDHLDLEWIPREMNFHADRLAGEAYWERNE